MVRKLLRASARLSPLGTVLCLFNHTAAGQAYTWHRVWRGYLSSLPETLFQNQRPSSESKALTLTGVLPLLPAHSSQQGGRRCGLLPILREKLLPVFLETSGAR